MPKISADMPLHVVSADGGAPGLASKGSDQDVMAFASLTEERRGIEKVPAEIKGVILSHLSTKDRLLGVKPTNREFRDLVNTNFPADGFLLHFGEQLQKDGRGDGKKVVAAQKVTEQLRSEGVLVPSHPLFDLALLQLTSHAAYLPHKETIPHDIPDGAQLYTRDELDSIVEEVLNRPPDDPTRERDLHALFRRSGGLSQPQRDAVYAALPQDRRGAYQSHLPLGDVNTGHDMDYLFEQQLWVNYVSRIEDQRKLSHTIRSVDPSFLTADPLNYERNGKIYDDLLEIAKEIKDPTLRDLTLEHLKPVKLKPLEHN